MLPQWSKHVYTNVWKCQVVPIPFTTSSGLVFDFHSLLSAHWVNSSSSHWRQARTPPPGPQPCLALAEFPGLRHIRHRTKTNKFGQTIHDVHRMDRINMIRYCKFLSKHGLTLDDNISAFVSRNIQTLPTLFSMATLKHTTNKTRPSPEKINEICNFLMEKSDKTNGIFDKAGISNHSGNKFRQDDSDLM